MAEKLFKMFVAVVLLAALWIAWGAREEAASNGRYVYQPIANSRQNILVDTRTGRLFYLNVVAPGEPVSIEENPLTGQRISHWVVDTRTGRLFYLNVVAPGEPVSIEENPLTGQRISHWAW